MRAVTCAILLAWPAISTAADAKTVVTGTQGTRKLTFSGGLGTQYEGLVIALLGSCSAENDSRIANKERFEKALKGEHLRIRFPKPRSFAVNVPKETVDAEEIVVPISTTTSPDHIFIRNGKNYRAFAKYEPAICFFLQRRLKSLLSRTRGTRLGRQPE